MRSKQASTNPWCTLKIHYLYSRLRSLAFWRFGYCAGATVISVWSRSIKAEPILARKNIANEQRSLPKLTWVKFTFETSQKCDELTLASSCNYRRNFWQTGATQMLKSARFWLSRHQVTKLCNGERKKNVLFSTPLGTKMTFWLPVSTQSFDCINYETIVQKANSSVMSHYSKPTSSAL